jgi:hypothetical protein
MDVPTSALRARVSQAFGEDAAIDLFIDERCMRGGSMQ